MTNACVVRGKARVGGEARHAEGSAQRQELSVIAHRHGELAVSGREQLVGRDAGMLVAHPLSDGPGTVNAAD